MKKYLLTSLFCLFFLGLFSQDTISNHSDSLGILKIERIIKGEPVAGKTPYYISAGQRITIRTFSDPHRQLGILTAVKDSSLVLDFQFEIPFSEIKEISWDAERKSKASQHALYIVGGTMMAGGMATWVNLFVNDTELGDGSLALAILIGIPMVIAGTIVFIVGATFHSQRLMKKQVSNHWRISSANNGGTPKKKKVKPYKYWTH